MKPEARILVAACHDNSCLALVLRGLDIDGAVAGTGCEDTCRRLAEKGYMGELRYSYGDCDCGLPRPPTIGATLEHAYTAARRALESLGGRG